MAEDCEMEYLGLIPGNENLAFNKMSKLNERGLKVKIIEVSGC